MSEAPATVLFEAIQHGDEPRVVQALADSPDLVWAADRDLKTALHVAAKYDQDRIAALLIGAGADLEAKTAGGMTPLQLAATMSSTKVRAVLMAVHEKRGRASSAPTTTDD
jgi:ankyrin repeat protein